MGFGNDWAPFSQNPLADGRKSTLHFCQVLHVKRVRPTHAGRIIPSAHCASHANQTGFHGLSEDVEKTMPTLQTCQIFRGMSWELIMMTGYFFLFFSSAQSIKHKCQMSDTEETDAGKALWILKSRVLEFIFSPPRWLPEHE